MNGDVHRLRKRLPVAASWRIVHGHRSSRVEQHLAAALCALAPGGIDGPVGDRVHARVAAALPGAQQHAVAAPPGAVVDTVLEVIHAARHIASREQSS